MPYDRNADLPSQITDTLPEHAQTIWRKVFNSAHEQYEDEDRAYKVAWGAVKNEYKKDSDGNWVKKD